MTSFTGCVCAGNPKIFGQLLPLVGTMKPAAESSRRTLTAKTKPVEEDAES